MFRRGWGADGHRVEPGERVSIAASLGSIVAAMALGLSATAVIPALPTALERVCPAAAEIIALEAELEAATASLTGFLDTASEPLEQWASVEARAKALRAEVARAPRHHDDSRAVVESAMAAAEAVATASHGLEELVRSARSGFTLFASPDDVRASLEAARAATVTLEATAAAQCQ